MVTDEERLRIARELRDPRGAALFPHLWKIVTGETAPLMDLAARHRLFDMLADLIEPQELPYCWCCGHVIPEGWTECPKCGARIEVNRDDE